MASGDRIFWNIYVWKYQVFMAQMNGMEKRNFTNSAWNGGKTAEMRNNSAKSGMVGMSGLWSGHPGGVGSSNWPSPITLGNGSQNSPRVGWLIHSEHQINTTIHNLLETVSFFVQSVKCVHANLHKRREESKQQMWRWHAVTTYPESAIRVRWSAVSNFQYKQRHVVEFSTATDREAEAACTTLQLYGVQPFLGGTCHCLQAH